MPLGGGGVEVAADQLVCRARVVQGRLPFRLESNPAFDYARRRHDTFVDDRAARFDGP